MPCDPARLAVANRVLPLIARSPYALDYARGFWVSWTDPAGRSEPQRVRRVRWVAGSRGSDFPRRNAPRPPFGGTCCCATMELTRWCAGRPVRPLETWEYWCSPVVGMDPGVLPILTGAGWPVMVPCVFCRRPLGKGSGWDHYDRAGWPVGPGCYHGRGCGGRPPAGARGPGRSRKKGGDAA